jgi:hypothetical protein
VYVLIWCTGRVSWFCGSSSDGMGERSKQRKTEYGNGVESEKVRAVSFFSDIGMHLSH